GAIGVREVYAVAHPGGPRTAGRGFGFDWRTGSRWTAAEAPRCRNGVPVLRPLPPHDGRLQYGSPAPDAQALRVTKASSSRPPAARNGAGRFRYRHGSHSYGQIPRYRPPTGPQTRTAFRRSAPARGGRPGNGAASGCFPDG